MLNIRKYNKNNFKIMIQLTYVCVFKKLSYNCFFIYLALINLKKMRNLILVEINYYKLLNLFLYN